MKTGTRITKNNLPKWNGRPQLWITPEAFHGGTRCTILYPDGAIAYYASRDPNPRWCEYGTGKTLRELQLECIYFGEKAHFGGYI